MRLAFLYALIGFSLTSCLENEFDTTQLITENDLTYLDPSQRTSEFPNDPYRIIGITPFDTGWEIIVEYTGGCESHQFFTHWDGLNSSNSFNTLASSSVAFTLLHNSKGDMCERVVRDTLNINLPDVFNQDFSEDTLLITVINGYDGASINVDPFLSTLSQNDNCNLSATLLGTTCNNGFWQNQWFLLSDTIANYEKIWIQPVRSEDTRIPETGSYEIGIRLLFGFEFSQKMCDELPDGEIIPASITCLKLTN